MSLLDLRWWSGALVAGAGCGLAGYLLLSLELPFFAVCLAHAALAGAVLAGLAGLPVLLGAFVGAVLTSLVLGPVADRLRMPASRLSGVLFSLSLGVAFLGVGLSEQGRGPVMSLFWGSLLLLDWPRIAGMAAITLVGVSALVWRRRAILAVLHSRELAWLAGVPASMLLGLMLLWSGVSVALHLEAVGGLMLYSLLVNPASVGMRHGRSFSQGVVISMASGALSACLGLGLALLLSWPVGASIVLMSGVLFLLAMLRGETRCSREPGGH